MTEITQFTNKINALIFSRNRSMQLDLLLRGFDRYAKNTFFPTIIYKYDKEFQRGLNKVKEKFHYFKWVEETDFRADVLNNLENTTSLTTCCFTDDTCWIKSFKVTDKEMATLLDEAHLFSLILRCGTNTMVQCHYTGEMQAPLEIHQVWPLREMAVGCYNFRQHRWETDFGRPFSLDGAICRTSELRELLKKLKWSNPRELDGINDHRDKIKGMTGLCEHSFVVTQSVNLAFDGQADNYGHFLQYSLEDLEQKYLGGYVIEMNQSQYLIQSSHVEIPYNFIKESE